MQVESSVKIFPGQPRGWALRYDGGNATAVKSADEAHRDMLEWLHTHLSAVSSSTPNQELVALALFFFFLSFLRNLNVPQLWLCSNL